MLIVTFDFSFQYQNKKCNGTSNNINDPYAKLCIPDVVKNLSVKTLLKQELMKQNTQNGMKFVNVNVNID